MKMICENCGFEHWSSACPWCGSDGILQSVSVRFPIEAKEAGFELLPIFASVIPAILLIFILIPLFA